MPRTNFIRQIPTDIALARRKEFLRVFPHYHQIAEYLDKPERYVLERHFSLYSNDQQVLNTWTLAEIGANYDPPYRRNYTSTLLKRAIAQTNYFHEALIDCLDCAELSEAEGHQQEN
jgi:hypothetical protein